MPDETSESWRRALELFEEAMERPPEERETFLREACGDDAGLRRQVEKLLESSDLASDFLEQPHLSQAGRLLRKAAGDPPQDPATPAPDEWSNLPTAKVRPAAKPAETIGPYRLLQKVGEGGMGEVWQAEQSEPIRRRVALKLIKAGMDTKQVIARFEAERQALALMDHPSIAKVFEAGETPRGLPYFAMEYVAGEPITAYCDRQRLNVRERLELFMQVCEGVQHAHQKGVIHRDLKPSNVLVSVQGGTTMSKIIDFGVAKATTQRLTERTMFTELGVLIGTPEYMSPEQAELAGLDVDTRTDVYSLGVILYELLTGTLPFESQELREAGLDEIRRRIREVDPPRPSSRLRSLEDRTKDVAEKRKIDPGKLISTLKGELDWIVMRALEKDRTRRYATPHDFGEDVARHLRNQPVVAAPPGAGYRAGKFVRRHRLGVGIAAGALVGLVAFGVAMTVQARRIAAERDRAERVTQFLVELFRESSPSRARGNEVTAREVLDRGARRIEKELASEPLLKAQMQMTIAGVYLSLGLFEKAEPLLKEALDIRTRELGREHRGTLRAMGDLARVLHARGEYEEELTLLNEVWEIQRRVLGDDHPDTRWILLLRSLASSALGHGPEAEAAARQVYETRRRKFGEDEPGTLDALKILAFAYQRSGRYAEAEKMNRRVVEGLQRVLGEDHPNTLNAVQNLAATVRLQGRLEEAEKLSREVFDGMRRVLGPEHSSTLFALRDLAVVYEKRGRYAEAEKVNLRVVEGLQRVLGEDHPETLNAVQNLAATVQAQGRLEEAEKLYHEAFDGIRQGLGEEHPDTLWIKNNLGLVAREQGQLDEAGRIFDEVLEVRRRVLGAEHPDTLSTWQNLANLKSEQGQDEEAVRLLREILEVRLRVSGAEHPGTLKVMNNLANIYMSLEKYDAAEKMLLEILDKRRGVLGPHHSGFVIPMYNLGCLSSIRGRRADALDWLRQAVEAGYSDADFIMNDPDLQPLHDDPEFGRLVAAARKNKESEAKERESE